MGVPSYFYWLVSRFEDVILHHEYPYEKDIGYLFLDFNSQIHPAVKADPNMKLADMYQAVIKYLETIVEFAKPTKGIYIAIDGVAPRAKMEQQRARRYKSVKEKKATDEIKRRHGEKIIDQGIDFNMISPGTEFMQVLTQRLLDYIKERKKDSWKEIKIHLSDASVPGEGEHKIMNFIRKAEPGSLGNIAIYGLDSDLIFLSMLNCPTETVLVRENIQFGNRFKSTREETGYTYLCVDHLKEILVKIMSPLVSFSELEGAGIFNDFDFQEPERMRTKYYKGTNQDDKRLIMDYVMICYFLGNDFLPHIPSLIIRDGGLNFVIQAYKVVSWKLGNYLVNPDQVSINQTFLKMFLQQLATIEQDFLEYAAEQREVRIGKFEKRMHFTNDKLKRELDEFNYVENKCEDVIRYHEPGWRNRYYNYHFHICNRHQSEFNKRIQPIGHSFLEGVKWSLLYYQGEHSNWTWYYKYHAAPLVSDLLTSLDTFNFNEFVFPENKPVLPFVQLMSILPPESSKLLPYFIGDLMKSRALHEMYPLKIELSMIGKKYLWECKPLLPDINMEKLSNLVLRVFNQKYQFTTSIRKRNSHGIVRVF